MIAALKPYEEYKETGQPWLGKVPSCWEVQRTKWHFQHRKEINSDYRSKNVLSLTLRGVVNNDPENPEGLVPKDYGTYQFFGKGNLVFKLIDLENLKTSRVGLVHEDGIMSSAYVRLIPKKPINDRFFYLQYFDLYSRGVYNQLGAGVRSTLGQWDLLNLSICIPSPEEQEAIVRFLDHAHGRIDRAIRAKRKVIALLNEQKQAIIHKAVTRGLNPDVPLKPSRISWLGDIPAHWKTLRLRFCVKGKLAYGANEAAEFDNPDWPRYLRITDFGIDGTLKPDTFRSLPPHLAKDYPVNDGDILFARSGATVGKAFLVRIDTANACYAGYLIRARPRPDVVLPEFLFAYTQSLAFTQWKDEIFSKATIQNIGADKYSNLIVPIPKVEEQKSILAHIAVEARPIKTAIARTESEIKLLREYRTRLTADVVTGKLDVREAAKSLPAESPEDISGSPLDSTDLESDLAEEEELEEVEG